MKTKRILLAIALVLLMSVPAMSVEYTITENFIMYQSELEFNQTFYLHIAEDGTIVGDVAEAKKFNKHGFIRRPGQPIEFVDLEWRIERFYGVGGETVVGFVREPNPQGGKYLYTGLVYKTGVVTTYRDVLGAGPSERVYVRGVSGDESIMVGENGPYGAVWRANTGWEMATPPIDFLSGADNTYLYDVNNQGKIVGYTVDWDASAARQLGFMYDGTTWTKIEYPGSDPFTTTITCITESGIILGHARVGGEYFPFLTDGELYEPLVLPASYIPMSINDNGRIVGYHSTDKTYSFIADPTDGPWIPTPPPEPISLELDVRYLKMFNWKPSNKTVVLGSGRVIDLNRDDLGVADGEIYDATVTIRFLGVTVDGLDLTLEDQIQVEVKEGSKYLIFKK